MRHQNHVIANKLFTPGEVPTHKECKSVGNAVYVIWPKANSKQMHAHTHTELKVFMFATQPCLGELLKKLLLSRFMGSRSHPHSVVCVCAGVCVWVCLIEADSLQLRIIYRGYIRSCHAVLCCQILSRVMVSGFRPFLLP